MSPRLLLAVAAGGAIGALARFALGEAFPSAPLRVTFAINVLGSLLLALLPALAVVRRHPLLPPFLGAGVLGGFTTLSTASEQVRATLAEGSTVVAATYLLGTLLACVAAVRLAHVLSTPAEQAEFEDEEGNE